uniref:Uncharacterized protein n=1 Tax=Arundo donax TaxID=35708 RepID=A0A0A9C498_ARUDO
MGTMRIPAIVMCLV